MCPGGVCIVDEHISALHPSPRPVHPFINAWPFSRVSVYHSQCPASTVEAGCVGSGYLFARNGVRLAPSDGRHGKILVARSPRSRSPCGGSCRDPEVDDKMVGRPLTAPRLPSRIFRFRICTANLMGLDGPSFSTPRMSSVRQIGLVPAILQFDYGVFITPPYEHHSEPRVKVRGGSTLRSTAGNSF